MIKLKTKQIEKAREKVCLPLDNLRSFEAAEERVKELSEFVGLFKIGKGSFTRFGPAIVKMVQDHGCNVFLDLKYHDIPNTVRDASEAATELKVSMFSVHCSGGTKMLNAAVAGAKETAEKCNIEPPKVLGVTVLTSINEEILKSELNVNLNLKLHILSLATLAYESGLDGIVCSAADLKYITDHLPKDFMYVTPGIKHPNKDKVGKDQMRVTTPYNAIINGSTILVIGRAITGYPTADERQKAAYEILIDINRALEEKY